MTAKKKEKSFNRPDVGTSCIAKMDIKAEMDIKADSLNDIEAELDLLESSPETELMTSKQRMKESTKSQLPVAVKATTLKFDGSLGTTLRHKEWRPKPLGARSSTAMGDYEMPRRSLPGP